MSDDGTRAIRILDDLGNGMFYLFKVFQATAEKSKACIAVIDNRSEWLVDFMGDGGSQCTQRGDPADVREVRLHLTQSFFGSLALSQIDNERDALTPASLEQGSTDQCRHATTVFAKEFLLEGFADTSGGNLCQSLFVTRLPFVGR